MNTDVPDLSEKERLDLFERIVDAVDAARTKRCGEQMSADEVLLIKVSTRVAVQEAVQEQLEKSANEEWYQDADQHFPAVRLRFLVDPGASTSVQVHGYSSASAEARTQQVLADDFRVLPRLEVTYGEVTRSAFIDDDGVPLGRNEHFSFPAGFLVADDFGVDARYDVGTGRIWLRAVEDTRWVASWDALPLAPQWVEVPNEVVLTFSQPSDDETAWPDWAIGLKLSAGAARLPSEQELVGLLKAAAVVLQLDPSDLELVDGLAAKAVSFPVVDARDQTVRYVPAWCAYATGRRRIGMSDPVPRFWKFYFCINAVDTALLIEHLRELEALAESFGDAVVRATHRALTEDETGALRITMTAPLENDIPAVLAAFRLHAVVAESESIEPYAGTRLNLREFGILRGIARALDTAHRNEIVFGDVKSSNFTVGQVRPNEPARARLLDVDGVCSCSLSIGLGRRTLAYSMPVLQPERLSEADRRLVSPATLIANDRAGFVALTLDLLLGKGAGPAALAGDTSLAQAAHWLGPSRIAAIEKVVARLQQEQDVATLNVDDLLPSCEAWLDRILTEQEPGTKQSRRMQHESYELVRLRGALEGEVNRNNLRNRFNTHCEDLVRRTHATWFSLVLAGFVMVALVVVWRN